MAVSLGTMDIRVPYIVQETVNMPRVILQGCAPRGVRMDSMGSIAMMYVRDVYMMYATT